MVTGIGLKYYIGIDIGGTKTALIIEDENQNEIYYSCVTSNSDVTVLRQFITCSIEKSGLTIKDIEAMSIGVPGIVNSINAKVIDAPGLLWTNLDFKSEVFDYFPYCSFIDNDVTMALVGELFRGNAKNMDNVFFLSIGTGLGSAALINGKILRGHTNSAGEIGYFNIGKPNDLLSINKNGSFGSLETYFSGSALQRRAIAVGKTPQQLFTDYFEHDKYAIEVVDDFIINISMVIANVVSLLNPEIVIIGGGVAMSLEPFLSKINNYVSRFTPIETTIALTAFANCTGAKGACEYAQRIDSL